MSYQSTEHRGLTDAAYLGAVADPSTSPRHSSHLGAATSPSAA